MMSEEVLMIKNALTKMVEISEKQADFHHDDMVRIICFLDSLDKRLAVVESKLAEMGGK